MWCPHWRDATDSTCLQRYNQKISSILQFSWQLANHPQPNHWSNEGTMVEYINEVIVPYVDRKRDDLDLSCDYPAVAIFDHFKSQLTERVTQVLEENNIHSVLHLLENSNP